MKKLLIFCLMIWSIQTSIAQNIGIRGGINFSNGTTKNDDFTLDTQSLTGFQLGLTIEAPIENKLYFNTALLYTRKGYKFTWLSAEFKAPVTYLEIPLNIEYKEEVGNVNVFAEAGPYIGIGLSAKVKTGNNSEEIKFGSDADELKRIDAGLNFGAGVELEKIRFGFNYEFGLVNIENENNAKTKLRNFALFAAYTIKSK